MDSDRNKQMKEARRVGDKCLKPFLIPHHEIKALARGFGAALATDRIVVDGCKVGYMYREKPDFPGDSGWRFLAGDETSAYLDDQWNSAIYEVNTVANYDPAIIPHLEAPFGSAFIWDEVSGCLISDTEEISGSQSDTH